MSTLANRPNTALLVVDLQNAVVAGAHQRDEVLANVNTLIHKARQEHVPVIWVQHASDDLYWTHQSAPGRTAGTVTTKEAHFTTPT